MGRTISKNPQNSLLSSQNATFSDENYQDKIWRAQNLQHKQLIGVGTKGYVLEAFNIRTNEKCAIKVFEFDSRDDPMYEYALEKARQACKANKIKCLNVVKTFTYLAIEFENNFPIKNKFAIIMELFQQNLAKLILETKKAQKRFEEQKILKFAFDLSRVLALAHQKSLFHTNVKEENIFVADDGETLKLGDFDIPLHLGIRENKDQFTSEAPELQRLQKEEDVRINWAKMDSFALGIVLLKVALLKEILSTEEINNLESMIQTVSANYSQKLQMIIRHLTAFNPIQRWSAEKVFKLLQEEYVLDKVGEIEFEHLLCEEQKEIKADFKKGLDYGCLGDSMMTLNYLEKAKEALMKSSSLNQYDRTMLANCLHNCALTYYDLKDYAKSISYHLLCLDLKKKFLGNLDVFVIYINIGKAYYKLGDQQKALLYFMKAYFEAKRSTGNEESKLVNIAKALDSIGTAYDNLGEYKNALENHLLCLEIVGKKFGENNPRYGKTLRNISRTLKNLGRLEDSKFFELKAKEINY